MSNQELVFAVENTADFPMTQINANALTLETPDRVTYEDFRGITMSHKFVDELSLFDHFFRECIRSGISPDRKVLEIHVRRIYIYLSTRFFGTDTSNAMVLVPSSLCLARMVSFFVSGMELYIGAVRKDTPIDIKRNYTPLVELLKFAHCSFYEFSMESILNHLFFQYLEDFNPSVHHMIPTVQLEEITANMTLGLVHTLTGAVEIQKYIRHFFDVTNMIFRKCYEKSSLLMLSLGMPMTIELIYLSG